MERDREWLSNSLPEARELAKRLTAGVFPLAAPTRTTWKALSLPDLSPDWRESFVALLV